MCIRDQVHSMIEKQLVCNSIAEGFPDDLAALTEGGLDAAPCLHRMDFTGDNVFTIDSETCRDMDDAVEVRRTAGGYRLAVHIADVAAYVQPDSPLDSLAVNRATSFYLPDRTIPMLPAVLSNGLCSLNPGVRRNTLSVIMEIDKKGGVTDAWITKGVIRSRVKGIYAELNRILDGSAGDELKYKYREVLDQLPVMTELYRILHEGTVRRGVDTEDFDPPYVTVCDDDLVLAPVAHGTAEEMVEEFMILANATVSRYLDDRGLPAIFRIQYSKEAMAEYQPFRVHHSSLGLETYTHFTSPIRRICDTKIHQILGMHLDGCSDQEIHDRFDGTLPEVCERATKRSRTARSVQKKTVTDCCMLFFQLHPGNRYTGRVVGRNRYKRPLLRIDGLNINVIGYETQGADRIGKGFSFSVFASNSFAYANEIQPLAV